MKTTTASLRRFALGFVAALLLGLCAAHGAGEGAPESRALLDALVRKGVLTSEEAAELSRSVKAGPVAVEPSAKTVTRLTLGGRVQAQFVGASMDVDGGADPATVSRFLVRRVYLTARAELGPAFGAHVVYDLANQNFDRAVVRWTADEWTVETGHRLVGLGREPHISSGALKAIERSTATRYFMEHSNGVALSASGHRTGVFAERDDGVWSFGGAITNPETSTFPVAANTATNNRPALWLNAARRFTPGEGKLLVGAGFGWSPRQGGAPALVSTAGNDLSAAGVFADYVNGRFTLLAEVLGAIDEGAAPGGADATPVGAYVQPAWAFNPAWEGVVRIGYLDTDGRGVTAAVAAPRFPAGPAVGRVTDLYAGVTRYFLGNDAKIQAGVIFLRGDGAVAAGTSSFDAVGLRSQLQVNF